MIQVDELLLNKFFMDEASSEEIAAIRDWAMASEENRMRFRKAFDLYAATTLAVARLQSLPEGLFRKRPEKKKRNFLRTALWTGSVAAAIAFGVFLSRNPGLPGGAANAAVVQTLSTAQGERASLTLADGTRIHLNGNSSLAYPSAFGKTREVSLSGQAYFEVAKDESRPFIVKTWRYEVEVTGTEFDVVADEAAGRFSTVLVKGGVKVWDELTSSRLDMTPGQRVVASADGSLTRANLADNDDQTQWNRGIISCTGMSFAEVMAVFEDSFGVRIVLPEDNIPENKASRLKVYRSAGIEKAFRVLQAAGTHFNYSYDAASGAYYVN